MCVPGRASLTGFVSCPLTETWECSSVGYDMHDETGDEKEPYQERGGLANSKSTVDKNFELHSDCSNRNYSLM